MDTNIQKIRTHAGAILREEFLEPLNITPHALAVAIKVPASRIADIVKERRGITVDTALRLAKYFGTTSDFWINLQRNYEVSVVENEKSTEIEYIIPFNYSHTKQDSISSI